MHDRYLIAKSWAKLNTDFAITVRLFNSYIFLYEHTHAYACTYMRIHEIVHTDAHGLPKLPSGVFWL